MFPSSPSMNSLPPLKSYLRVFFLSTPSLSFCNCNFIYLPFSLLPRLSSDEDEDVDGVW